MTISKRTVIDQIEVTRDGTLCIRMHKQIVDSDMPEGEQVIQSGNHRTSVVPNGDVDGQFLAVNEHLERMGFPPVNEADIERVRTHARAAWSPEVIAAWTVSQRAEIATATQQIEAANAQRLQALAKAESIEQLQQAFAGAVRQLQQANVELQAKLDAANAAATPGSSDAP